MSGDHDSVRGVGVATGMRRRMVGDIITPVLSLKSVKNEGGGLIDVSYRHEKLILMEEKLICRVAPKYAPRSADKKSDLRQKLCLTRTAISQWYCGEGRCYLCPN